MMRVSTAGEQAATVRYRFHHFELVPLTRSLSCGGWPVRLSSRAFDVLVYLIEHAGMPISKERLIAHVWPSTIVEDVNLRVQMSSLRKALDDGEHGLCYIESVPGKGYSFVAPVEVCWSDPAVTPMPLLPASGELQQAAPWFMSWARPALGRAAVIAELVRDLPERRLRTIAGPAGIGKSVVAREVTGRLVAQFGIRACVIDVGAINDACSLPRALAIALGLHWHEAVGIAPILKELRRRRTLLLLDSCECRLQETAALAAQLLLLVPELWMLATSREPLLARGEAVYRLPALAMPVGMTGLSIDEALRYPAIELFCERARARSIDFVLRDGDVDTLVELCARLDGVPLAIELAAARTELFTIDEILHQMDYRFHLLADGRRTGLQRHRSMWDALDWSFLRLPAQEQIVLRRLSVFQHEFGLKQAIAAVNCLFVPGRCVLPVLANLVAKSLVVAESDVPRQSYRLLNSTRAYAREQLLASKDEERFPARWEPR